MVESSQLLLIEERGWQADDVESDGEKRQGKQRIPRVVEKKDEATCVDFTGTLIAKLRTKLTMWRVTEKKGKVSRGCRE